MPGVDPRTPLLVGAGQVTHKAAGLDDALSPIQLMAKACRRAAADAGLNSVPDVDSIRVVALLSWRYRDPARFVAADLGITSREHAYTSTGGNTPQSLVNATAIEIQNGTLDCAFVTGGEAWRTRGRARKAGVELWERVPDTVAPDRVVGKEMEMNHPHEVSLGITAPVQVYPMFESALRAANGESRTGHLDRIARLWAGFADVAGDNPYAWVRSKPTADQIGRASTSNRMIGAPYPKMMNSNNDVDQGAALLMCSVAKAEQLGISRDRWIFIHAGVDCHEHNFVSHRWSFTETPAIAAGGARALELAGIGIDDVGLVDLYSCFPSAVQLGATALGLSFDRQLTRTGGLPFAGGPWNNYVMHAIATMVTDLRSQPGERGLLWANGGYVTKHAFGVYSTEPPATPFRHDSPQAQIDALPRRELATGAAASGRATIEAYTVMHDRDGSAQTGYASCLLADGRRAWGRTDDRDLAGAMLDGEWVGQKVRLDDDATLRVG